MEDWKECKLGEIVSLVIDYRGKTPKKLNSDWASSGYRALSAKNIKTGHIVQEESIRFVDESLYKLWMKDEIKRGDILITSEAPFGQVFYWNSDEKIVLSQRLFGIRINSNFCSQYVYYYMTSEAFQKELDARATGTTVVGLRQPELMKCIVKVPPLATQKKIAEVLSSLDDKIELNNKINANLEQQAQAIFKSWFVDFEPFGGEMPAGWKEKPLYEYADFINGTSFKDDEYGTEGVPIIKIAELKNGITDATQYFNGSKDPKYNVKDGDILFSWSGNPETSIDIFIWTLGNAILNQHTFNVKSNTEKKWFSYCLLKYFKPEFCHRAGCKQTTGLGHVTASDLKQIMFSSDEKSETDFENLISPILNQVFINKIENQKLSNLRDTLLPKLMNGEIEV